MPIRAAAAAPQHELSRLRHEPPLPGCKAPAPAYMNLTDVGRMRIYSGHYRERTRQQTGQESSRGFSRADPRARRLAAASTLLVPPQPQPSRVLIAAAALRNPQIGAAAAAPHFAHAHVHTCSLQRRRFATRRLGLWGSVVGLAGGTAKKWLSSKSGIGRGWVWIVCVRGHVCGAGVGASTWRIFKRQAAASAVPQPPLPCALCTRLFPSPCTLPPV